MEINIRKAALADALILTKMIKDFNRLEEEIEPIFKKLDNKKINDLKKDIKRGIVGKQGEFILVAEGEKIWGFIFCETKKRPTIFKIKKIGFVKDLYIVPTHRKKGLGKRLVKEAEKRFKKKKLKYVGLTSLISNKNALKAYDKMGFKEYKKELRKQI